MADDSSNRAGWMPKAEVIHRDERLEDKISTNSELLQQLRTHVFGRDGSPGLEDRLNARIDTRDTATRTFFQERLKHNQNNTAQDITDSRVLIEYRMSEAEKSQRSNHEENRRDSKEFREKVTEDLECIKKDVAKQENKWSYVAGAVAVATILVNHFWK